MKRILRGALALLLTPLLCLTALAAGSAQVVRAFVSGEVLYAYVELSGVEGPITQVEAKLGAQSFPASGRLETVQQAGYPITYLLLVDNSTSMPAYREELTRFCAQLAQDGGEDTRFILATLGDSFQVREEDLSPEELEGQLSAVPFDERVTRLHSCIDSALDYFETVPRQSNELRAMVLLTDGVQYDPGGETSYEALLERIGESDVMLHSLGLGSDDSALESLGELVRASGGVHQVLDGALSPEEAASALTRAGGALLVVGFDLTGCTAQGEDQPVSLTFASNGALVCRGESVVDLPEQTGGGDAGTDPALPPAVQPSPDTAGGDGGAAPAGSGEASPPAGLALAGGAALAVLAAGLVWSLRRKKRAAPERREQPSAPAGLSSIHLRLDVPEDTAVQGELEWELAGEITVGNTQEDSVLLGGPEPPVWRLRLFLKEGALWCAPVAGDISVNQEPLQAERRMRGGDYVSCGGLSFRLLF